MRQFLAPPRIFAHERRKPRTVQSVVWLAEAKAIHRRGPASGMWAQRDGSAMLALGVCCCLPLPARLVRMSAPCEVQPILGIRACKPAEAIDSAHS